MCQFFIRHSYVFYLLIFACLVGCQNAQEKKENATAQVRALVEKLDKNTTEIGSYIQPKAGEITEVDPWGTPLDVSYAKGGLAETVTVRSAGPDKKLHTDDDIQAQKMTANLKGIGEGLKDNAEETAANVAKGVVKGTATGVKDAIKNAFSLKNKAGQATPVEESKVGK